MWRVAIAALLLIFALAACATPPAPLALPAPAETSSPPETSPPTVNTGELGVTLPISQPLPSLVILDAGVITVTQTVTGADEPVEVLLPAQGAFAMPVWAANGDHQQPLAVILADADRVCEANEAEEWPCPAGLQTAPYAGLRYLAQALALRGYAPLIVNLGWVALCRCPVVWPCAATRR